MLSAPDSISQKRERCSVLQYYHCSSRPTEVTVSGHSILFACLVIFVKYPVQAWRHVIRFGRTTIVPFKIFTWRVSPANQMTEEWKSEGGKTQCCKKKKREKKEERVSEQSCSLRRYEKNKYIKITIGL